MQATDLLLDAEGIESSALMTPAFVYDEATMVERCEYVRAVASEAGARVLFSLKPLTFADALALIAPYVDGFSASSLFEATLARDVIGTQGTVHLTTPGLRPDEIGTLAGLCDYISFNSLSQWGRHKRQVAGKVRCGLRVNPQQSFVEDPRYNPCREHSKLGVPLEDLATAYRQASLDIAGDIAGDMAGLEGLHIHSNCDSTDFEQLHMSVRRLEERLGGVLGHLEWVNLGGGYLFDAEAGSIERFHEAVGMLRAGYGLDVFIEPGAAIVREAGYLVSTVLDIFPSEGKSVAVLDTSVNHMPEVFEYQFRPDVLGVAGDGPFSYILAGSTCLAGDIFGEYSFAAPLEVGSRVTFTDAGAYTLVKAHTFNGLNLPSVYALTAQGDLVLKKDFTYEEFAFRWGGRPRVSV